MAKVFVHRLGTSRAGDRTRVWLEGKRLSSHGFTHRAPVQRVWSEGKLTLRVVDAATFDELPRAERTTVAGSVERPIIDITGLQVAATFKGETVNVSYSQGRIVISNDD